MDNRTTATDAAHFVKTWLKHRRDLDENSLLYLDSLMDALVHIEPTSPDDMRQELFFMVPLLQYGTARRLVDLKYHSPPENSRIQPA